MRLTLRESAGGAVAQTNIEAEREFYTTILGAASRLRSQYARHNRYRN